LSHTRHSGYSQGRYTDSNGIVAFFEPGLMDQKVFFHVRSHGYEFAKDGLTWQLLLLARGARHV
jgi:hypothetical protein